ncbi:MAG TPA: PAS domain S-box protein, partial [Pyrinomonadaceae bacterium]|nr:PAS domain S-box protein [Pyrinomonadaceae bacterium]
EVEGRPLHYFVHHTKPDGTPFPLEECPIDRALPENNQEQGEDIFVHRDGHFYPVFFTASPIREEGRAVGTIIEVRDTSREKQTERERELLLEREREAREEVETLNDLGRVMSAELDLQKLVQAVTDAATELTGAQFGAFFYNVLDEEGASYMLYALSGVPREHFENFPMPRATHLFGPTFEGQGTIRLANVRSDPRYAQNPPYNGMPEGHLPVTSYLAVPVKSRTGQVLGGLFFGHSDEGVFTARHERLVFGLAAQAAVGIDNARLFDTARREREAARRSEERYRNLLENANDIIYTHDLEGNYLSINRAGEVVTGYKREDILGGMNIRQVVAPDHLDLARRMMEQKLRDPTPTVYELDIIARDGRRLTLEVSTRVAMRDGRPFLVEGVARDVTERKRAEEERARLRDEVIRAQGEMLAQLSTPLIPLKHHAVVVPLIGAVSPERAEQFLTTLLRGVRDLGARVAIIDITGVPEVDARVAQTLVNAAQAVRLLGTEVLITGVRSGVARTLVSLGVDLTGLRIRRDLQSGIDEAETFISRS